MFNVTRSGGTKYSLTIQQTLQRVADLLKDYMTEVMNITQSVI
jgi:hypothetical protein